MDWERFEQGAMSYLTLQNLSKRFRGITAVRDLWLTVDQGEILALLGPSGCGKSTTLQLVAGVLPADTGTIGLDGRTLNRLPPEKREIALVLQRGLLFPHLTVGENVAFGLKMRGCNRSDREAKAETMLELVQLGDFAHRRPAELSGGQAQRVALARALVIRPKLLLLDEPLSALDANLRQEMQELILQLQAQTEVTMLLVTHDQAEAVVISNRIALMLEGCLRQVAPPELLYRQPCDLATARFMGGVNFFSALAQGHQWQVGGWTLISKIAQQGEIQATIRPEQIQIFSRPPDTRLPEPSNMVSAMITAQRFTGTQRRLTLVVSQPASHQPASHQSASNHPDWTLQAWVAPTLEFGVGQMVWAYLPPDALWWLAT